MKLSLILATINRDLELIRFFDSVILQGISDLEIIVVDQNEDNRVDVIVLRYLDALDIKHIKTRIKGLSKARNIGLNVAEGDVIAFPDDDCWYPEGLLGKVMSKFLTDPYDGFSGMCIDENGLMSVTKFSNKTEIIGKNNVFQTTSSITFFVRRKKEFFMDETLGVGSEMKFGAGEDIDFMLRYIQSGCAVQYDPNMKIGHPQVIQRFDKSSNQKGFNYGAGLGRVLRNHNYCIFYFFALLFRSFIKSLIFFFLFDFDKARFYYSVTKGRVFGWFSS